MVNAHHDPPLHCLCSVAIGDFLSPHDGSGLSHSARAGGRGALHRIAFGETLFQLLPVRLVGIVFGQFVQGLFVDCCVNELFDVYFRINKLALLHDFPEFLNTSYIGVGTLVEKSAVIRFGDQSAVQLYVFENVVDGLLMIVAGELFGAQEGADESLPHFRLVFDVFGIDRQAAAGVIGLEGMASGNDLEASFLGGEVMRSPYGSGIDFSRFDSFNDSDGCFEFKELNVVFPTNSHVVKSAAQNGVARSQAHGGNFLPLKIGHGFDRRRLFQPW